MATTNKSVDNGVNVDALLGAREALSKTPEAGQFAWRATCNWVNGTYSRSTVEGFYGLGGEQKHKTQFSFDADHPELLLQPEDVAAVVLSAVSLPRTAEVTDINIRPMIKTA